MKTAITLLAAGFIAGCSGGQQAARDGSAESAEELHRYESDFRPSDHDPDRSPAHGGAATNGSRPDTSAGYDPSLSADEEYVQGFRVQLFSTTSIDAAKAKRAEAESYFPGEWFYMQYDPPTYKLRAGNFRQRFEADRFARLAAEKGFTDAWTVPEKVFKRSPSPPR
jgi:hypothetical protein